MIVDNPREIDNLRRLHTETVRCLHNAETQVVTALDRILESVTSASLTQLISDHRRETEDQISRLNRILVGIGLQSGGWQANGVQGLIEDLETMPIFIKDPILLDVSIMGSLRTLTRCEEAMYVNSCTYARLLGYDRQAKSLNMSLREESRLVQSLSELAQTSIFEEVTPRPTGFLY